jgi:NAD(P)-dependent dehydrogenase (short-subunit alcohol dehydrogenase family)
MSQRLLITGSSGMAAATARLAASRGSRVFIVGKKAEECQDLCSQIPGSAYAVADVGDYEAVQRSVQTCIREVGGVDAIFNAAGISGRSLGDGPLHECSPNAWQELMRIHAAGTFHVCREVIRHWRANEQRGTILNVSSVLARFPAPEFFATHAYAASKGAVEAMSIAAAAYYAPHGIRINAIEPGLVRTPMSARAQSDPAVRSFVIRKQPLKKDFIEAEEIARIALFLLSDESMPITGELIRADAGWAVTG